MSTVLYQPENTPFWGFAYARTIPEILQWAASGGMIFVEREPVVFSEFMVKSSDGSPLRPEALEQLRHLSRKIKEAALASGTDDPYLHQAYSPAANLGIRAGMMRGEGPLPPVDYDVGKILRLLEAREER